MVLFTPLHTDTPQAPQFTRDNITCFKVTNESAQCRIHWTEPANKDSFDLDHYQLSVGNKKVNIDAKENTVIISVQMGANVTLDITAFDRCGKMSANASNNTILFNPNDFVETTDKSDKSSYPTASTMSPSKSCGQSGGVNAAFAILALLVTILFIWGIMATVLAIKWKIKGKYEKVRRQYYIYMGTYKLCILTITKHPVHYITYNFEINVRKLMRRCLSHLLNLLHYIFVKIASSDAKSKTRSSSMNKG